MGLVYGGISRDSGSAVCSVKPLGSRIVTSNCYPKF
jgi:hypothetical protein